MKLKKYLAIEEMHSLSSSAQLCNVDSMFLILQAAADSRVHCWHPVRLFLPCPFRFEVSACLSSWHMCLFFFFKPLLRDLDLLCALILSAVCFPKGLHVELSLHSLIKIRHGLGGRGKEWSHTEREANMTLFLFVLQGSFLI
jgi:hypothetical protein